MILRDWLIVAGAVILFIIVLDGLRRVRNRGRLRLDIDAQLIVPEVEDCSGELPNGGARRAKAQQPDAGGIWPTEPTASAEPRASDSAPPLDHDDLDLLLDQDLKGVGQGADRWLSPQESEGGACDDSRSFEARPERRSSPQSASLQATTAHDEILGEQREPFGAGLEFNDWQDDDGLSGLRDDAPLVDQFSQTWQTQEREQQDARLKAAVDDDAGVRRASDRGDGAGRAAPELSRGPVLEVVGASGDDLDLNQPVSLLVEQVKAREYTALPDTRPSASEPDLAATNASLTAEPQPAAPAVGRTPGGERPELPTGFFDMVPEPVSEPKQAPILKKMRDQAKKPPQSPPEKRHSQDEDNSVEDDVLIITVTAKEAPFGGSALFRLVEACGMDFGAMSLFHRYEDGPAEGALQFSMANAIKPGTFDLQQAEAFSTPAVTFFLNLAEPRERMVAFDCMLATAQCLADHLGGELKDEHRSSLRSQTIEHYRQRLRDYERRRLSKRS